MVQVTSILVRRAATKSSSAFAASSARRLATFRRTNSSVSGSFEETPSALRLAFVRQAPTRRFLLSKLIAIFRATPLPYAVPKGPIFDFAPSGCDDYELRTLIKALQKMRPIRS